MPSVLRHLSDALSMMSLNLATEVVLVLFSSDISM
jgi:hypothetical protein